MPILIAIAVVLVGVLIFVIFYGTGWLDFTGTAGNQTGTGTVV